ncbi:MAG: glycerol kinase, partial [Spirochaetia bacterium]|nr:glycerol kinase [Spirochaetia bacterium]
MEKRQQYIGAIDQGTTSTRFILFNEKGEIIASHQLEHRQIFPQPGWVEHNPMEIWNNTVLAISETLKKSGTTADQISGIGITNQRETVVAWDPKTGKPCWNAIVWQDLRGKPFVDELIEKLGADSLRDKTGLPLSPYFAGSKIRWMLDNVEGLASKASDGSVIFGTMDTWLLWNLTGGSSGGVFITDFTNASRYQLMDLENLCWDRELLELYKIPEKSLPEIKPSIGVVYGYIDTHILPGGNVPLCGILGDQQSALFGQACFSEGMAKNTYGTGCFLLVNTGEKICQSKHGLLTTAAYHKAGENPKYALEGSIAVAGSL